MYCASKLTVLLPQGSKAVSWHQDLIFVGQGPARSLERDFNGKIPSIGLPDFPIPCLVDMTDPVSIVKRGIVRMDADGLLSLQTCGQDCPSVDRVEVVTLRDALGWYWSHFPSVPTRNRNPIVPRGLSPLLVNDVGMVPEGFTEEHHGMDLGPCVVIKRKGTGPTLNKPIVNLTVVHEDPVAGESKGSYCNIFTLYY